MTKSKLITLVSHTMLDWRYKRAMEMLRTKAKSEKTIRKHLGRRAEAEAIINLVRANS